MLALRDFTFISCDNAGLQVVLTFKSRVQLSSSTACCTETLVDITTHQELLFKQM